MKNHKYNDITEERSLFLVGIPKLADEEVVKDLLKNYQIKNVKFCKDRDTGAPKGTGFAEFRTKEDATNCLEANSDAACKEEFIIDGSYLKCLKALSKKDLQPIAEKNKAKDKRNIYLVREGVIRDGTRAADGVSKFDLAVRVQREKVKRKLLENLHCFVSPTRLFFCNIPDNISEKDLRSIFKEHSPKDAVINECKIMKDHTKFGDDGLPRSKGFGFLNFTIHEHALAALRAVNNNPLIFDKKRRPIVEFSIENQAALSARQRRQEKSVENQNMSKGKSNTTGKTEVTLNNAKFVGGKAEEGMKMATHFGAKKCKKSGKITRNTINNRLRKRRKNQKKRVEKEKNKKRAESMQKKSRKGKKTNKNGNKAKK